MRGGEGGEGGGGETCVRLNWETSFRGTIIDFRYVETVSPDSPPSPLFSLSLSLFLRVPHAILVIRIRNRTRVCPVWTESKKRGWKKTRVRVSFPLESAAITTSQPREEGGGGRLYPKFRNGKIQFFYTARIKSIVQSVYRREGVRIVIGFVARETWLPRNQSVFSSRIFRSESRSKVLNFSRNKICYHFWGACFRHGWK